MSEAPAPPPWLAAWQATQAATAQQADAAAAAKAQAAAAAKLARDARREATKARRAAERAEREAAGLPPSPPPAPSAPALRAPTGGWAPGQSGNPAGLKPGTLGRGGELRKLMADDGESVVRVVIAKAQAGNLEAARLVLDRIAPPMRPEGRRVSFRFDMNASFTVQAQQVANAVALGELCVEDGALLIQALTNAAGLKAVDELEQRLRDLEGRATKAARSFGAGLVVGDIDEHGNLVQ
jgi:hypothetical protein